jgi:hypothetical protein
MTPLTLAPYVAYRVPASVAPFGLYPFTGLLLSLSYILSFSSSQSSPTPKIAPPSILPSDSKSLRESIQVILLHSLPFIWKCVID